jgi:hypothetical protein
MGTNLAAGVVLPRPNAEFFCINAAVMNAQSTGSITPASSDPPIPMLIDLNYLSHPYDGRVAIEALRTAQAFTRVSTFERISEQVLRGAQERE